MEVRSWAPHPIAMRAGCQWSAAVEDGNDIRHSIITQKCHPPLCEE